ncbi:MAG: hypothetical protein PHV05_05040 [Candidatus Riflebacteria bacterium]|nr:hypothetical protein [Candidatus Riflebacteria bacterium]
MLFCGVVANAQMPNFFGGAESTSVTPKAVPVEKVGITSDKAIASGTYEGQAATPGSPSVPQYDPGMDNHLKAPPVGMETGLLGLPVSKVEERLRFQGAKNHSYAFGKYSRLTFSVYLVTLYFDKERRVGGFSVEPRKPYKTVEPEARRFFMETFLKDSDLSKFNVVMAADRLEVRYSP